MQSLWSYITPCCRWRTMAVGLAEIGFIMNIWKITVENPVEALSYRRILGLLNISTIKVAHGNRQF